MKKVPAHLLLLHLLLLRGIGRPSPQHLPASCGPQEPLDKEPQVQVESNTRWLPSPLEHNRLQRKVLCRKTRLLFTAAERECGGWEEVTWPETVRLWFRLRLKSYCLQSLAYDEVPCGYKLYQHASWKRKRKKKKTEWYHWGTQRFQIVVNPQCESLLILTLYDRLLWVCPHWEAGAAMCILC